MSGVSFSIKKTEASKVVRAQSNDEKKVDYVLELEGREIKSTLPKQEKKELIIKMIGKNNWRGTPSQNKDADSKEIKSSEELALDREAAEAVIRDMNELRAAVAVRDEEDQSVIPLLLQNKPPVVEGREKDELADIELRPEQSTLEEYDNVPIENFGVAMLRGMGWEKGKPVGLTNKGLVEPIEFTGRIGRHGLGSTPRAPPPDSKRRIKKPGEEERKKQGPYVDKDGRVKYYKRIGQEIPDQPLRGFVVGNYARVRRGPHQDLCGKIMRVDEDDETVVLRLAINGQTLSFAQRHLELVTKEVYLGHSSAERHSREPGAGVTGSQEKQYGLVTKKDRCELPPSKRLKRDSDNSAVPKREVITSTNDQSKYHLSSHKSAESAVHSSSGGNTGGKKKREDDQQWSSKERSWLYPHLRVRMVDQRYKKGKYYNTKVLVLDVVSNGVCDCQTDTGKLLEGVTQSMLETVVPRATRSKVMIVGGARKGQVASIVEQDRHKARAIVEMSMSKEVLQLDFDDICEYTGTIDDDF